MSYSGIFSHIVTYLEPCATPVYSEPCHIQNPDIFRIQDVFGILSRYILAYIERCVMLAYWKPCYIQNNCIFRILAYLRLKAYSEPCLFRHISGIFYNDSYNNINFLFLISVLLSFQRNLKRHVFWLQWHQYQCSTKSIYIMHDLWNQRYNIINKTHPFLWK